MPLPTKSGAMRAASRPLLAISAACSIAGTIALMLGAPARAADASAWGEDSRSAVRLIAGTSKDGAALRAGIEIKMQSGWKTYWRYPGDSGVPPRFDFSGSDNVKTAKVLYPAPHAFSDETGHTIGYKNGVIFPVQVTPREPGKPVALRLKVDYAVCEKLCVPAEGRADLVLGAGASAHDAALAAAEARVPRPASAADADLKVKRVNNAAKPLIAVDFAASAGQPVELFVEGPTADWALPVPQPAQGAPAGRRHFGFELDGLPSGVDPKGRFELTFTLVEGERAVEIKTHLD